MKRIPLTQARFALVDDEDFEWLNQWKWNAIKSSNTYYAVRMSNRPTRKIIRMHRLILNVSPHLDTDHVNHNGLDNTRKNLRSCTGSQNQMNGQKRRGSSRFKGVYLMGSLYRAQIRLNGKLHEVGCFDSEIEAAKAYDVKAQKLFGEFANLNFP